jgi:serine/threonine protein kinase/Tol biopolymer transport system component
MSDPLGRIESLYGPTLAVGARIGAYEIVAPIGAGGMGEVYCARDTRLDRLVAVKVLPARMATDPNARARFEREARAIAALNHPTICAVHDVGHDGGHDFLVMELLEGETLHQRLAKGALPITELVELGIALADALDAAHSRGVIHRDLKPANIFLTSRGQPKILDFGVAKVVSGSDETTRQTNADLTGPGAAAGTIAYMSPEQLRGETLDARSDLFSLGLVLYEMATGRRAFDGRSSADISAAILAKQPEPPQHFRPDLPAKLEDAILKTLDKDRELRCQTAAELRADLRRLKAQSTAVPTPMPTPPPAAEPRVAEPTSSDAVVALGLVRRHRSLAAIAGLIVVAATGLTGWWLYRAGRPETVGSTAFPNLEQIPISSGDSRFPAVSPDGKFVAFRQHAALWVKQVGSDNAVQIVPPVQGRNYRGLTITPDGQAVDYLITEKQETSLWRTPLLGGSSRPLVKDISSAVGWSLDGKRMAFLRSKGLAQEIAVVVADASGQNQRVITMRRPPLDFINSFYAGSPVGRPAWSEDGGTLLLAGVSNAPDRADNPCELVAVDVATRREGRVSPIAGVGRCLNGVAWLDGSHLLLEGGDSFQTGLWSSDLVGSVWTPLTRQLAHFVDANLAADRKTVVAQTAERRSGIWLTDAAGGNRRLIAPDSSLWAGQPFIDDQGEVTYSEMALDGRYTIYRARAEDRHVIVAGTDGRVFGASRDGRTIVFNAHEVGQPLYRINSDGTGLTKLVERNAYAPAIAPDGSVLFSTNGPGVFRLPLQGGAPRQISDRNIFGSPEISLDGSHVLFGSDSGMVVVCRLPDCTESRELSIPFGVGAMPQWMADGKGLSYINPADQRNIWVQPLDGTPPHALTHLEDPRILEFCWSRDGKSLAIARGQWNEDIVLLKGLR